MGPEKIQNKETRKVDERTRRAVVKEEPKEVDQTCGQSESVHTITDEQRQTDKQTSFNGQVTSEQLSVHSDDVKTDQNLVKQSSKMCTAQSQSVDSLKAHRTTHSGECVFCDKVFAESKDLKVHLKTHQKDRYGCVHCPMKFKSQVNLMEHLIRHKKGETSNEPDVEPILKSLLAYSDTDSKCTRTDYDAANSILKTYLESSYQRQNVKPEDSNKRNDDSIQEPSEKDSNTCESQEPKVKGYFQCEKCPRKFQLLKKLHTHRAMHALGIATFKCQKCGREFQREKALEKHKLRHNGMPKLKRDRVYSCDLCPRTFGLERSMKTHRNVHFGWKEYECRHCGKKFNEQTTLDTHAKCFHFQPAPTMNDAPLESSDYFKCQQCDKLFPNSDDFRSHVDTCNADERVRKKRHYACNLCGRIFDDKRSLGEHKRTHLSLSVDGNDTRQADGTYKCIVCVKIFKWKNTYKRHMQEYHPTPVTFSCMRCKVTLSSLAQLSVHLAMHGVQANEF